MWPARPVPWRRAALVAISNELIKQEVIDSTELKRLIEDQTQLPRPEILRQQVLERLVLQEIQMQRANRIGVQVSEEMLNEALRDVATRNGIRFEDLPAVLAAQGIDYATYRDEMRREITLQLLRQRDVTVTIAQ